MRPQGGPAAQSVGGDEEENRVFLLVVGLGSQVIFVNSLVINFIIIFFLIFVIIINLSVPVVGLESQILHHFNSSHFSTLPSITIIIIFIVPVNTMMSDAIFIVVVIILSDCRCLGSFLRQAAVLLCLRWELWETLGRRVFKSRTLLCTPVSLLKCC